MAITFPSFILIVIAIIDISRAVWIQNSLQLAATQAARCYAINPTTCGSTSATQTFAGQQLSAMGVTLSSPNTASTVFTPTKPTCGYQVAASMTYNFLGDLFLPTSITLKGQACWPT